MLKLTLFSMLALLLVAGREPALAQQPIPAASPPGGGSACVPGPTVLGVAREIVVDPSVPVRVGLKTYPQTIDLQDHEVVLSFDDGPSVHTTPRVLDALEQACVRATFFLIGRNAKAAPALVRREIADHDTVGHHTWSHPAITERGLPDDKARRDIQHGFEADDLAGYGAAEGAPRVPFFRFPGFADTPALLDWLANRHIAVFGADLWASDWVKQTPEAELQLVMKRLDAEKRGIILLHDTKEQTAAMLPNLLRALKQGGYRVVALRPGQGITPLRKAPPGWTSETDRTITALWPSLTKLGALPMPGAGVPTEGGAGIHGSPVASTPNDARAATRKTIDPDQPAALP